MNTLQKTKSFIGKKYIKTNKFRTLAYDSIICEYFCVGFTDFMLEDKGYQIVKGCSQLINLRKM